MVDLETTACSYLERLDTFRLTNELKRMLEKMENRKNDQGKLMLTFL